MKTLNLTSPFIVCLACALSCGTLSAQEVDLSNQRAENQNIMAVPGYKLDHKGIILNPTPQQMSFEAVSGVDISQGVALKDKQKHFADEFGFLRLDRKGVKLTVDFGAKAARKNSVREIPGAYALQIDGKEISIVGYDEAGAFYGIQTLRQIVESPAAADGKLPAIEINDYPTLPYRGIVEGFYGTPWSHEVRLSLIDFLGRFKMNTYVYGPKDDPYHRSPHWRDPYPQEEARHITELIEACNRNHVEFTWAIHPGQDIKWNEEDYMNLVNKFNMMYDLGVRAFAIFFDDIVGDGTNAVQQTDLLNRLTEEFVKTKGDVAPLIICPTDYTKLWADPTPQGSLVVYGQKLDPAIKIFWTGDVVCADLTRETLDWVNSRIKRPAYFWWNYPVTDYVRNLILQGPVYGLEPSLTRNEVSGITSNPMEHGEASKLALYGVADYSWNTAAYNPIDNWERGLKELVPDASEAYRTFAIHSCDTETGYRRDESWETRTFRITDASEKDFTALWSEFDRIEKVPGQMEQGCSNQALLAELRPWLVEFGKLGTRGKRTIELARVYLDGQDDAAFWEGYVNNLMSREDRKAFDAHKSGTMKLQPFYENAMFDMAHGFFRKLTGEAPMHYKVIGSFINVPTSASLAIIDNDPETYFTSKAAQTAGDWIGVDMGCVTKINGISILQGRNSDGNGNFFDHAILECSKDGRIWTPFMEELNDQYEIRWQGDPVEARYIRLKRLESDRKTRFSIRSFEINPVSLDNLGFSLQAQNPQQALTAFDKRLDTSYSNSGALTFGVPEGTGCYTLLMRRPAAPVQIRQLQSDGTVAAESTTAEPFVSIPLAEGVSSIQIDGEAEIFEIIARPSCAVAE